MNEPTQSPSAMKLNAPSAEAMALTDEQCDEFRRLRCSFRDMVRAIYVAGQKKAEAELAAKDAQIARLTDNEEATISRLADEAAAKDAEILRLTREILDWRAATLCQTPQAHYDLSSKIAHENNERTAAQSRQIAQLESDLAHWKAVARYYQATSLPTPTAQPAQGGTKS